MPDSDAQLEDLRRRIDVLDEEIIERINRRAELVVKIGESKAKAGVPVYVPDREREVMDRIGRLNRGPLGNETLAAIYREMMSGSLVLERPPRIGFVGPRGSFSHLAAVRKFGSSMEFEPLAHIKAVFEGIERQHLDLGVVPVENSSGGGVVDTIDGFMEYNQTICAEINLAVHHHLLGQCPIEEIETVYSKPEAFAQCQRWLMETGLFDRTVAVASTSKAVEMASQEPKAAAIGGALAGELFSLSKLCDRIEDDPNNVTRFLVISRQMAAPTGRDKTSVLFSAADKAGALVEVLDVWRQAGINMTFIESRPNRRQNWAYSFFVDLEGHRDTPQVAASIQETRGHCAFLKVLGSFPRDDEVLQ